MNITYLIYIILITQLFHDILIQTIFYENFIYKKNNLFK